MSHGVGLLVALIAGPLLVARAVAHGKPWEVVSGSVFAARIVVMYLALADNLKLPLTNLRPLGKQEQRHVKQTNG